MIRSAVNNLTRRDTFKMGDAKHNKDRLEAMVPLKIKKGRTILTRTSYNDASDGTTDRRLTRRVTSGLGGFGLVFNVFNDFGEVIWLLRVERDYNALLFAEH